MANKQGEFIWYELMTSDPDAAARFYEPVVGWTTAKFPSGDMDYRIFSAAGGADENVGGCAPMPATAAAGGLRPGWFGYIGVDDVDRSAEAIVAAGGTQHVPPTDIPGVGRFAMMTDPQGVLFYIMRGASDETSTAFDPKAIGHCSWNELTTTDQVAALDFYSAQFGWRKTGTMPMGAMGDYSFIGYADGGDEMIGAMMNKMESGPGTRWSFYFRVDDIDRAAGAVTENGGTIYHGPTEVPGGDFIIVGGDPQGAMFGVVGARNS